MVNSFPPVVVRIDDKEWILPVEVNFRMVLVSHSVTPRCFGLELGPKVHWSYHNSLRPALKVDLALQVES